MFLNTFVFGYDVVQGWIGAMFVRVCVLMCFVATIYVVVTLRHLSFGIYEFEVKQALQCKSM